MSIDRQTFLPDEAMGLSQEEALTLQALRSATSEDSRKDWEHFTPEFVRTKSQTVDTKTILRQIELGVRAYTEGKIAQLEGWAEIKTELPVSLCFLGDLHFGNVYSNHDEIIRKFALVRDTPNVYGVLMANLIDNGMPGRFPDNMLANIIPPDKQVLMMRKMIEELNSKGKILAAVTSPCHEGWTYRVAGQDINALMFGFPDRKFPILENGGVLHLTLGSQEYYVALYHQVGPFESNFNETHALRQLNRLRHQMRADVMAGAHRHVGAVDETFEGVGLDRRLVVYVRTGSEKGTGEVHDQFIKGRSGDTGEPTGQMVHLYPNQRKLFGTCDFDTGILAHESIYLRQMALLTPKTPT